MSPNTSQRRSMPFSVLVSKIRLRLSGRASRRSSPSTTSRPSPRMSLSCSSATLTRTGQSRVCTEAFPLIFYLHIFAALSEALKADHGFNVESRAIRDLIEIMSEYDAPSRRGYLQFITGSPKLPIGGKLLIIPSRPPCPNSCPQVSVA